MKVVGAQPMQRYVFLIVREGGISCEFGKESSSEYRLKTKKGLQGKK